MSSASDNEIKDDFISRLSKPPLDRIIQNCKHIGDIDGSAYFQDIESGILTKDMKGKWVAYVQGKWWNQQLYDTEKDIYKDNEFMKIMYETNVCYIVEIGKELKFPIIC